MKEKISRLWPSALVPLLYTLCTIIQFWPALTGAISLSKVQQLAEWDSLFAAQSSGQSMLMDPSLVYLMMPGYLLKATLLHGGQLPLWNPYSGLGCPLAADPQALAFSPLHLPLIFSPGLTAYNQVLVLEIIILGLSTFALARSLKLGLFASAFAMVAVAFCPYERWYLELLGNGFCFVPLVYWLILGLRSNVTGAKIWFTAFGCAMMVLSAHPELSFFSIGLASVTLLIYVLVSRDQKQEANGESNSSTGAGAVESAGKSAEAGASEDAGAGAGAGASDDAGAGADMGEDDRKKRLIGTILALAGAGVLTFMLAAPMLLPFLEYLRNSDSYKFGSGAPAIVPWQTLIFNLLQPGYGGASPTLGPCALLLIPLAFCTTRPARTMVYVLAGLALFCLALTGKMFPLSLILSHPPFSYLVVNYAFPSLILLTALLSAFGLNAALDAAKAKMNDRASAVKIGPLVIALCVVLSLLVVLFPVAAAGMHLPLSGANFDLCLPDYTFNRNDVVRYSIFAFVAAAAVLWLKLKPQPRSALLLMAAVCLGQCAEIGTAAKSMPKRARFEYKDEVVVPALKAHTGEGGDRFISTGNHLLRPNSNVVFGISDLRTHNPLFPKRYLSYMKACGAELDEFNQVFECPLSPLLDLADVRAVLSQGPVVGKSELPAQSKSAIKPLTVDVETGIRATFTPDILDKERGAIFGRLYLTAPDKRAEGLKYNLALFNGAAQALWFSDPRPLANDLKRPRFLAIRAASAATERQFLLALQIYDEKAGHWLSSAAAPTAGKRLKDAFVLGTIDFTAANGIASPDYKLVFQSATGLSVYENLRALPRAYAVHGRINAAGAEESLAAIQSPSFNPRRSVVIESVTKPSVESSVESSDQSSDQSSSDSAKDKAAGDTTRGANGTGQDQTEVVSLSLIKSDRVVIDADLKQAGTVVLTDMYYPGWQAEVDDRPAPIMRANYLMRAIDIPAGKHRIVFSFFPATLKAGLGLLFLALLTGLCIAAPMFKRAGKK